MARVLRRTRLSTRVPYRHTDGNTYDAVMQGFQAAAISTPGTPTVTPQGATGATAYNYRISAVNSSGETLASTGGTTATGNATLSATNFNRVTWSAVTGAEYYKVYGRTGADAALLFMTIVRGLTFDDTGTITPSGALPGSNTTTSGYNIWVPGLKYTGVPAGVSQQVKFAVQANTTRTQTGVVVVGR